MCCIYVCVNLLIDWEEQHGLCVHECVCVCVDDAYVHVAYNLYMHLYSIHNDVESDIELELINRMPL